MTFIALRKSIDDRQADMACVFARQFNPGSAMSQPLNAGLYGFQISGNRNWTGPSVPHQVRQA